VARSLIPRLTDIVEAIERIHSVLGDMSLEAFENDWQRQWLVERGIEIVSEASRHLTDEMKARHPAIPWQKVAGIGNVLRPICATQCLTREFRRKLPLQPQLALRCEPGEDRSNACLYN
jgi:hypothetical protein